MPVDLLPAYGTGVQIHVEHLADYISGRELGDVEARWNKLFPADESTGSQLSPVSADQPPPDHVILPGGRTAPSTAARLNRGSSAARFAAIPPRRAVISARKRTDQLLLRGLREGYAHLSAT